MKQKTLFLKFLQKKHLKITTTFITSLLSISLLSSCQSIQVDNTYLGDAKVGAYAKAPGQWDVEVIQENALFSLRSFNEPGLTSSDLMKPTNELTGLIGRRSPNTETPVSLDDLGLNMVFSDVNAAAESGEITILSGPLEFSLDGKPAKVLLYTVTSDKGVTKVKQVWVIDPLKGNTYGIALGCSVECFDGKEKEINSILESFTVS
jgi:hypothetical protein